MLNSEDTYLNPSIQYRDFVPISVITLRYLLMQVFSIVLQMTFQKTRDPM